MPTFRLPTLIHSRSANAPWLYEISHKNPLWIHPGDAGRLGITEKDLVRVETEIGWFVLRPFLTEGLAPGIVACSHHLGRWHQNRDADKSSPFASAEVELTAKDGVWRWRRVEGKEGGAGGGEPAGFPWWREQGVHQNMTFPVHPDPISGMHCWHQRVRVRKADPLDRYGDLVVDRKRAREVHEEWQRLVRPPTGDLRRPLSLARAVWPVDSAYRLKE